MTKVLATPRRPVENWQQKLDLWTTEVQEIIDQAKAWAESRGWATIQDQKIITEEVIGSYEVSRLLIHAPQGRLLLEPVARFVVDAEGRFDFCALPSYDSVLLATPGGGWAFYSLAKQGSELCWSEESFDKVAHELLTQQ